MAQSNKPKLVSPPATVPTASISWEGDAYEIIRSWPAPIRIDLGHSLREMQAGRPATLLVRPMPSIAKGVFELKTEDEAKWYRLLYLARRDDVIYVLDCFEKNTRKTEKKDLARALARYKNVQQRLAKERKDARHK